jgi:hypothetical protein
MFNLLPLEEKKKIRRLYLTRFAVASLLVFTFLTVATSVLLMPSFIIAMQKHKAAQVRKEIITNTISASEKSNIKEELIVFKKNVDLLKPADTSLLQLIEKVLVHKEEGVSISSFAYNVVSSGNKQVIIGGIASERDKLFQFQKKLEQEKTFARVDLPISNFAKDKDIIFTMTIGISNE